MITQTAPAAQTRPSRATDFRSLEGFGSLSSIWGSCLQELPRGNRCCRFRHDRIRLREPTQRGVVVAGVWNTKSRRSTKSTKTRAAASVCVLRALRYPSYLRDPNVPLPPATLSSTCPVKRRAVGVTPNAAPRDSPHGLYHNSAVRAPVAPSAVTVRLVQRTFGSRNREGQRSPRRHAPPPASYMIRGDDVMGVIRVGELGWP